MLELQQLNGELDVGQRAPAEFEMEPRVFAGRYPLAFDPRLRATDLAPPLDRERVAIAETVHKIDERGPELGVARD